MGGFSGLGSLFSGPSTMGGPSGGAPGTVGTTPGVRNDAGKLVQFDPSTMAGTYSGMTSAPPGMPNLGLPSDAMKTLTTGQPEYSNPAGTDPAALITKGVQEQKPVSTKIGTGKLTGSGGYGGPLPAGDIGTAVGASAPAPAAAAPALKQVGGTSQQPLYVNDQWNSQTGTSMQVATPALGPQTGGQAPFWTDGKGNYFYDSAGTKPVTGGAATQLKNQFG